MYDPQLGRFHTQDRFAEKYINFTPYQYAANNPVLIIDINGDSLSASEAFLNNSLLRIGLSLILGNKTGYNYLARYAAAGQSIKIGHKTYAFDKDGDYNKSGINLELDIMSKENKGFYSGLADVDESKNGKGFDIKVEIDPDAAQGYFENLETQTHEIFLEAETIAQDVKDGKRDYSNIPSSVKSSYDSRIWAHGLNNIQRNMRSDHNSMVWPGYAYRILKSANSVIRPTQPYNRDQIIDLMTPAGNYLGPKAGPYYVY